MKKKENVTENSYRVSDHKVLTVRMIEGETGKPRFEIQQTFVDAVLPLPDAPKGISLSGSDMKMGLGWGEFVAIVQEFHKFYVAINEKEEVEDA